MKVTRRIHSGYKEMENALKIKPNLGIEPIFEKYQYLYTEGKNTISLVQFTKRMYGKNCWEIYQVKGKDQLFEDVERYPSKEKAENRIKELFKR